MQTLSWYARRLRTMSAAELTWRGCSKLRDLTDRLLLPWRQNPRSLAKIATDPDIIHPGVLLSTLSKLPSFPAFTSWREALLERSEKLFRGQLTIFDLENYPVGALSWNYEYKARKSTPEGFAADIDYRDHDVTGDCKFVWEPNRHQHWVVLARAYHLTGDDRYAAAVQAQMESWIAQCPFGTGMNWRSPLELAIRLINWAATLELIGPERLPPGLRDPLIRLVYRHLWEIRRKYSRFSSANNHRIGEAAGVFIGSSYFSGLPISPAYRAESRQILLQEIERQTYPDGGTREQAMGYHLFVLEFFLLSGLVARRIGEDFPASYWRRLEGMLEFVAAMLAGGRHLPMFGDSDDGYVLDFGTGHERARDLLAVGGILLGRPHLLAAAGGYREAVWWLLGDESYQTFERLLPAAEVPSPLSSQAFPQSGYYLLQHGQATAPDRMSVTFDCGELGFGPIAAHGHADALSITLRVGGRDVLVDPGTYDYFSYRPWRDYFRSTRAHNTVVVDGRDQSEPLGLFLWGRRARTKLLQWEPATDGGIVAGEHDGYRELGVTHRRTVRLDGRSGELLIEDDLEGEGEHTAEILLHFAEHCRVAPAGNGCFRVAGLGTELLVTLSPELDVQVFRGSEHPIRGWVSRRYHRKIAAATVVASCRWMERFSSQIRVRLVRVEADDGQDSVQPTFQEPAVARMG